VIAAISLILDAFIEIDNLGAVLFTNFKISQYVRFRQKVFSGMDTGV
jgi:hypothetical protein